MFLLLTVRLGLPATVWRKERRKKRKEERRGKWRQERLLKKSDLSV